MSTNILKSFISQFGFVSTKTKHSSNKQAEINILNIDNEKHKINGAVIVKNGTAEIETITFETQLSESDDMLLFKTSYQSDTETIQDKAFESVDTFAIVNQEAKSFFTPRTKYLIHLVDGTIKQAYIVNKKYKFSNGISENYTKMNMDNKDIVNDINNAYSSQKSRR